MIFGGECVRLTVTLMETSVQDVLASNRRLKPETTDCSKRLG